MIKWLIILKPRRKHFVILQKAVVIVSLNNSAPFSIVLNRLFAFPTKTAFVLQHKRKILDATRVDRQPPRQPNRQAFCQPARHTDRHIDRISDLNFLTFFLSHLTWFYQLSWAEQHLMFKSRRRSLTNTHSNSTEIITTKEKKTVRNSNAPTDLIKDSYSGTHDHIWLNSTTNIWISKIEGEGELNYLPRMR